MDKYKNFVPPRCEEIESENSPLMNYRGSGKILGYAVQTKSASDGGDIRWYYCRLPLLDGEVAAAIPHTEIVRRKDFIRFGVHDSLALEGFFLRREDELLAYWWQELADSRKGLNKIKSSLKLNETLADMDEDRIGVPVKGGLYEVDLAKRHCFPVYWNGDILRVLRGHWFAFRGENWRPLREDISEQLEEAYRNKVWNRRTFQQSGLFAARVDLVGSTQGVHALFTGEDDTWEAWLNVDTSGFSYVFASGSTGIKLRRGFSESPLHKPTQDELQQQKDEDMDDHCSQVPVRHVVFMVHGIGQRLEKSNLVDDVNTFRCITENLSHQHLSLSQRCTQRVLFLPCQWRKGLKLSSEAAVNDITLNGLRGLRVMLSATVHDVLYYMSPVHCQDIINSVSNQLNRLYMKFLRRNPGYDGKVSIYGHSLGSVLSHDILCHQDQGSSDSCPSEKSSSQSWRLGTSLSGTDKRSPENNLSIGINDPDLIPTDGVKESHYLSDQRVLGGSSAVLDNEGLDVKISEITEVNEGRSNQNDSMSGSPSEITKEETSCNSGLKSLENELEDDKLKSYIPPIKYVKLKFKVDTFFAVGSPLGLFLALRNIRVGIGKGQEYWGEGSIIEEMPACRQMLNIFHPFDPVAYRIEPLVCKEHVNNRPVTIQYHKGGRRLHIRFKEFAEDLSCRSRAAKDHIISVRDKVLSACQPRESDEAVDTEAKEVKSYGSNMLERLAGTGGRIDHMLQDKTLEHQYLQAMGSHTNYWRDKDTALFILKHLYQDV